MTGERGIYATQRVDTPKSTPAGMAGDIATLHTLAQRRRLWLPARIRRVVDDEAAG